MWLAVLAVCRRPAACSSVGPLGRQSQKRGSLLGFVWAKARAIVCLRRRGERRRPCFVGYLFDTVRRDRQLRSGRGAAELALDVTYSRFLLSPWLSAVGGGCRRT